MASSAAKKIQFRFVSLQAMSHKNTLTYQELGHVKSQILDKAESVLS